MCVFSTRIDKMIPHWFPWIFVGGIIFAVFGYIGTKYKDKEYKQVHLLQDFISGSIVIGFMGILIPDIFPIFELPSMFNYSTSYDDFDLQIGPPRLIGKNK